MTASSAGLVFLNGVGAIGGPIIVGWLLSIIGPQGYWVMQMALFFPVAFYALWRTTRRASIPAAETSSYVAIMPSTSIVGAEVAQEVAIELSEASEEENTA